MWRVSTAGWANLSCCAGYYLATVLQAENLCTLKLNRVITSRLIFYLVVSKNACYFNKHVLIDQRFRITGTILDRERPTKNQPGE